MKINKKLQTALTMTPFELWFTKELHRVYIDGTQIQTPIYIESPVEYHTCYDKEGREVYRDKLGLEQIRFLDVDENAIAEITWKPEDPGDEHVITVVVKRNSVTGKTYTVDITWEMQGRLTVYRR